MFVAKGQGDIAVKIPKRNAISTGAVAVSTKLLIHSISL